MGCQGTVVASALVKTIIRISSFSVDSPERIAAEKLPAMALKMLAEVYSARREDEALLVIDAGKDGLPVYFTIGSNPPELVIGGRQVYAVFDPPDCQEPLASFFDEGHAQAWMEANCADSAKIGKIDSTDKPIVRVAVTLLIIKDDNVLMGKIKGSGFWTLPEGDMRVGETIEAAVRRAAKSVVSLDVGKVQISRNAPYVSTFIEQAGQHFLSLVMVAEYIGGEPKIMDPLWESWAWCDGDAPPEPRIVTVQQIFDLAARNTAPKLPANPPSLVTKAKKARAKAKPIKKVKLKSRR